MEARRRQVIWKYTKRILYGTILFTFLVLLLLHLMSAYMNSSDRAIAKHFEKHDINYEISRLAFEESNLRFVKSGNNSKRLIFFVHGAPGTWDAFKSYMIDSSILESSTLISMDRLGYGDSNLGKAEVDINTHIKAAKVIIEEHSSEELILVGHSYGGPIVGQLGLHLQHSNKKVIMVSPLNDPVSEPVKWYAKLCNSNLAKPFLPNYISVATEEKINHSQSLEDISSFWRDVNYPITHYHGALDNLAPFQANVDFSIKHIPSQYLKIITEKEGNHLLIWNQYEKIKDLILN